jgi:exonuclease SbcC
MIIRRVTAHAFGPLTGTTLEFAETMTVVYGSNESAKSSWHAACYAALCGRRRGRASSENERRFEELHRPWDRVDWLVGAEITLDDGRRVELRQDLAGKVDCHAHDLVLGDDLSAEIMNDGTPDAARWLGLDRASFAATACVFQAQVLTVLARAGGLQEQLQRAAAGGAAEETAAAALARLAAFRDERVGSERANSTKPLRRATVEARRARDELAATVRERQAYEERLAQARRLRERADAEDRRVRLAEAVLAARQARTRTARADEAIDLDRRLGGIEPDTEAGEALAREVAAALSAWSARPTAPQPRTPGQPWPGTASGPAVGGRAAGGGGEAVEPTDDELYALARALEAVPVPADPVLARRVAVARSHLADRQRRAGAARALGGAGLLVAVLGAIAAVAGNPVFGAVVFAAGLALGAAGWWWRGGGGVATEESELRAAEVAESTVRHTASRTEAERVRAAARCARLGIVADPATLRRLARDRGRGVALADRDDEWRRELARSDDAAGARIMAAAHGCGLDTGDLGQAVEALRAWSEEYAARAPRREQARRDWARLHAVLAGRTVADLVVEAEDARAAARRAAEEFVADEIRDADGAAERLDEAALRDVRAAARRAAEAAGAAEGSLAERARGLPPVSEAEERVDRADRELARVRQLAETLALTSRFLTEAQRRTHEEIAMALAGTVRRWLPEVSGGRYTDVVVDPRELRVQVCGPTRQWRDAARLSYGTAEQVYLLLRLALVEHLSEPGTRCPLLLDDVTVHADERRTAHLLDLLLRVSAQRQVILFTQQEQVRRWAHARLGGVDGDEVDRRYAVRELEPLTAL